MIEVEIINCRSKSKVDAYQRAVRYFAHALMPKIKTMHIDICIENNLDADAFCTQIEPKYFIIEISRRLPFSEKIKSIAHEMVHCKQFYSKSLQYKNNKIFWNGKAYALNAMKRKDLTQDDYDTYLSSPWEVEAYHLENELYSKFINDIP